MISILGCGWLGLPLAEYLIKEGYKIKGSTHSSDRLHIIQNAGIETFYLNFAPSLNTNADLSFFDNKILILNIPPQRREDIVEYHEEQFKSIIKIIKHAQIKRVLFVSSTSVYPNVNRVVTENEILLPEKESGKALLNVENMLQACTNFKTTIIRFGGLIGYERKPGRFLAGKKQLSNGEAPVNLIHRDDCIEIIYEIIRQEIWGEVFNACADEHPTRKEYYSKAARIIGLPIPLFEEDNDISFKIVSNEKLKRKLNHSFIFPDPRDCLNEKYE